MGNRTAWQTTAHVSVGAGDERVGGIRDTLGWPTYEIAAQRTGSSARELGTLRLRWYDVDPTVVPGTPPSLDVSWEFFTVDQLPITGPHHGRYLEVLLQNPGAGRTVSVSVADTNAPEQRHRAMQVTGLLLNGTWAAVPAGGTGLAAYGLPTSGPVTLILGAPGAKGEFRVNAGSTALADVVVDPADDKSRIVVVDVHRAPLWIGSVINRGTTTSGFSGRAITGHA